VPLIRNLFYTVNEYVNSVVHWGQPPYAALTAILKQTLAAAAAASAAAAKRV